MDEVRFEANIRGWVAIKKMKIDEDTPLIEASRILASIHDSLDRKIWEYLKEEIPTEKIDKKAYELTGATYDEKKKQWTVKGRKTEQQIAQVLAKCNSATALKGIKLPEVKQAKEIAKSYLTRKCLDLMGVRIELDPKLVEKYIEAKSKII